LFFGGVLINDTINEARRIMMHTTAINSMSVNAFFMGILFIT
jgi:hypothetical protein